MVDLNINTTNNTVEAGTGSIEIAPSGTETVTINNGVVLPDGTKAAPAIRLADDTNTGIYSPAAETISLTGNGEDVLRTVGTASAVNYLQVSSATTGNDVVVGADGTDANVGISFTPKGTGNVSLGNFTFDADATVGAGQDNYVMTYDNATGTIGLEAAAGGGGGATGYLYTDTPTTDPVGTGTGSLVIGDGATAGTQNDAVVIGNGATATGAAGISIGVNATNAAIATAVGYESEATSVYATAIGAYASATGSNYPVAIGGSNSASGGPDASGTGSIAIGSSATASGTYSVGIGGAALATGTESVVVGYFSNVNSCTQAVAIGHNNKCSDATGDGATMIGHDNLIGTTFANNSVVIGRQCEAKNEAAACVSIGNLADCYGEIGSIAIGQQAVAGDAPADQAPIAIGYGASANTSYSVALGRSASAPSSGLQIAVNNAASTLNMSSAGAVSLTGADASYVLPSYTVATAPTGQAGAMAYFTDGNAGAATAAVHDGTNWKVVALGATISAT